jgi:hypothetical protein
MMMVESNPSISCQPQTSTICIPYHGRAGLVPSTDDFRVSTHAKVVSLMAEFDKATSSFTAVDMRSLTKQLRLDLELLERNLSSDGGCLGM